MDRTTGSDNIDIGGGRRGFRNQNKSAGLIGTEVDANFLNGLQEEIMTVITDPTLDPTIVPSANNWGQLLEAINRKIEAVRVLQPIFPDVRTVDGKFSVTSPGAGTVRIGAGTEWVMRGGKLYTSEQTDLITSPSKVYHLRWVNGSFALFDLAALSYNPAALAEDNVFFDTSYDDMLVARISTGAGNVATITSLVNRVRLILQTERRDVLLSLLDWGPLAGTSTTLNWARTPDIVYFAMNEWRSNNAGPDEAETAAGAGKARAVGGRVPVVGRTRYGLPNLDYYYEDDMLNHGTASWTLLIIASS